MKTSKSDAFIKWLKKQSKNDEAFRELKKEAVRRFANFLSQSNKDLISYLQPRLEFGRENYGDRIFSKTSTQLLDEEHMENADAFIYYMIALYLHGERTKTRERI